MKTLAEKQHTPQWFASRRGRVSASEAHKALMGRHTKGRRLYVKDLADGATGLPDFEEQGEIKPWFADGIYYESWARGWYSFKFDIDVIETGFVVHDDYNWIGCSPDGLVPVGNGGVEIKFRKSLKSFAQHAQHGMPPSSYPQVQTSMFVTGADWWDYVNYWRSVDHDLERGHRQRVYRDQAYIENTLLPAFVTLMDDVTEEIRQRELRRKAMAM